MAQFITVHGERHEIPFILTLNLDNVRSIKTRVGFENCYCEIDGLKITELYNEVMEKIKMSEKFGEV